MTAGCAAPSRGPNETGCAVWPLPGQGQLWTCWHAGNGVLRSCCQHPQVFILCSVPAGLDYLIFLILFFLFFSFIFLILYISCLHPEQQKGEFEVSPPAVAVQDVPPEHPAPWYCCGPGANPPGTHTFQHQTPQFL